MKYPTARKVFSQAGEEIDADFKTNPHAFRKGRATYLASKGMNAAQLCEYFGWSDFSTAKTYIRMAQKDLDNALKKIQGIEPNQEEEIQDLRPIKCDCGTVNPATRDYCKNCGELISKEKELLEEVKEKETKEKVKSDLLKEMFSEFGVSEKEVEEKISRKVKEDLENKDFL